MTTTLRCSFAGCAALLIAHGVSAAPGAPALPVQANAAVRASVPAPGSRAPEREAGVEQRARSAFGAGVQALGTQQWATAEARFRQSLALVPRQSTLYDLAVALYMQGRPRECISVLDQL